MARNVKLLLTENVDSLGIVGDVVTVRTGYARNYLLPRDLATQPSEEKVKALAAKRAEAERMLAELRTQREKTIEKMQGLEVHLIRSCNDQGILYGAITQQDIAAALIEKGFPIKAREVRLGQTIKRIDAYDVHVKLDADLDAAVKLWVVADRKLDLEKASEQPVEQAEPPAEGEAESKDEARPAKAPKGERAEKGEKPAKGEKAEKAEKPAKGEKAEKGDKADKGEKGKKPAKDDAGDKAKPAKTGSFSKVETGPTGFERHERPHRSDKGDKGDKKKSRG